MTGHELDKLGEDVAAAKAIHARIFQLHRACDRIRDEAARVSILVSWQEAFGFRQILDIGEDDNDGMLFRTKIHRVLSEEIEKKTKQFAALQIAIGGVK